jgi:hypothetical protein
MFEDFNFTEEMLENIPCVVAHAQIEALFYCSANAHGYTRQIQDADKYIGRVARREALDDIAKRYPGVEFTQIVFHYLT